MAYLGLAGTPAGSFDAVSGVTGGIPGGSMYDAYQPLVAARMPVSSPLAITATFGLNGTAGAVNAHIEVTEPITTPNNVVQFFVVEDGFHGYPNLGRLALPVAPFTLTEVGQSVDVQRAFSVDPGWVPQNIGVIVFVESQSTYKQVFQTAKAVPHFEANVVVDATPDGVDAPWRLTGPNGVQMDGHGDRAFPLIWAGDYTLTWQPVPGWTSPVPASPEQVVGAGGTITFTGTYTGGPLTAATDGPLGGSGHARGVAFADYDGDGDQDILVTQYNEPCRLLRNEGAGAFTDVTSGPLALAAPTVASTWADFDNDGDLDVYQTLDGQPNRLLRNDGGGTFTDVAALSLVDDAGAGRGAAWADYDNDGKVDLLVVNDGGDNMLYHAIGDLGIGRWLMFGAALGGGDHGRDNAVAWSDIDNDGDQDYYLTFLGRANAMMQNLGSYGFWDVAGTSVLADAGVGMGCAWGDYNNDGYLDLYVPNDGGADVLALNDGTTFNRIVGGPLGDTGRGQGCAWGDWDNDGDLDLYVSRYGQSDLLLRNDGGNVFTRLPLVLPVTEGNGMGCAWADVDGDGDLDLYLANDGGSSALLRNDNSANGNHWLEVDLVGVTANRSAIGARLSAVTGERRQVREIESATGCYSQNALTAHFGLGAAAAVETLTIRWPGGGVQTFRHVVADQRLTIRQDQSTGVDEPGTPAVPAAFALLPCRPNPFNPATTIAFTLPSAEKVRLAVYDAAGRLVRTLVDGVRPAGRNELQWNGRNDAGVAVASGVYFCRLEADSGRQTMRMNLVK